ncbi:MAG: hypothetical protein ACYS1A_13155 [Planctomycetota bacterium]|jgi:hypothetical protein
MKRFLLAIFERVIQSYLREIPISTIRLERRKVFVEEGWGGQSIESFPPCGFFRMFTQGRQKEATAAMEQWYYNRLIKNRLYDVPKAEGGMQNGSLYRLISKLHRTEGIELKSDLSNADEKIVRRAIQMRVQDRFALVDSIKVGGYRCRGDFVRVTKEGDFYTLMQGHHRVAALAACGYSSVAAATSMPIILKLVMKMVRLLLGKEKDYHSEKTKKLFSTEPTS